jgi:hypothetical protein
LSKKVDDDDDDDDDDNNNNKPFWRTDFVLPLIGRRQFS